MMPICDFLEYLKTFINRSFAPLQIRASERIPFDDVSIWKKIFSFYSVDLQMSALSSKPLSRSFRSFDEKISALFGVR